MANVNSVERKLCFSNDLELLGGLGSGFFVFVVRKGEVARTLVGFYDHWEWIEGCIACGVSSRRTERNSSRISSNCALV
jgi:hypothetical protein